MVLERTRVSHLSKRCPSKLIFSDLHDIDVLVETKNITISDLRNQILKLDSRFATEALKFYFVKLGRFLTEISRYTLGFNAWMMLQESSIGVKDSRNNVLIETMPAGMLGLPSSTGPTYIVPGSADSKPYDQ